jgi:hypothetical protein
MTPLPADQAGQKCILALKSSLLLFPNGEDNIIPHLGIRRRLYTPIVFWISRLFRKCEWEIQEECNNARKLTLVGGASGGMFSLMCRSLREWTVVVPPPTTGDDDLCRDAPSPKGSLSHCCCWESDPRMTRARPIPPPFTMSDYLPHLLSETLQEVPLHKRFKP